MPTTKLRYSILLDSAGRTTNAASEEAVRQFDPKMGMVNTSACTWDQNENYDYVELCHVITRNTQEEANSVAREILKLNGDKCDFVGGVYQANDVMGVRQFSEETDAEDERHTNNERRTSL